MRQVMRIIVTGMFLVALTTMGYAQGGAMTPEHMKMMNDHMKMMKGGNERRDEGQDGVVRLRVLKVRAEITSYEDPGWYTDPPGTVTEAVTS